MGRRPFYFFVIADVQMGMAAHNRDLSFESENLEKFVEVANRLHPAFVVNCGDIVNRAGDAEQIQSYRSVLAKLDPGIRVYNVPGNHDLGSPPTPASLKAYRRAFGKEHYLFRYQDFVGIVVNVSLIKSPELAPREAEEQSEWLTRTLAKVSARPDKQTVVFQHFPWFVHRADEADEYFNLPLTQRAETLRRLEHAGVRHIFAGHLHQNAVGTEGLVQMHTVGPLGKPLGKAVSGFGVVRVDGRDLQFTWYPLSDPPARLPT